MNTGHVENKTVTIPEGIPMSEIEKIVNILNTRLKNVPLVQFKSKLYNEISNELSKYVNGYQELLRVVESVLQSDEKDRIFLSGMTNMLTQPEFKDVDKVKSIFDLLEEAPTLIKLFTPSNEGIEIKIGAENSIEAISILQFDHGFLFDWRYAAWYDWHFGTYPNGIWQSHRFNGSFIKHMEVVLGRWYGK